MTDSAHIMISKTYDPRCETIRFAWRKIRFAFAVSALVGAQSETYPSPPSGAVLRCPPRGPHPEARCAASPLSGGSKRPKLPSPLRPWSVLRGRFAAPQNEVFEISEEVK